MRSKIDIQCPFIAQLFNIMSLLNRTSSSQNNVKRYCRRLPFVYSILLRFSIIGCIASLVYFQFSVSRTMLRTFEETPDSFTVDTLYLNWNTSFPGVTICQVFNGERNWELNEIHFGEDRDKRLDDFVIDITYFSGTCYSCDMCKDFGCPADFDDIVRKFRSGCADMITNCTWNSKEFDCCSMFLPLQTEFGTCYTINSVNTIPPVQRQLIMNRKTGPGVLEFGLREDVQIFIHPPNEVPHAFEDKEIKQTVLWGSKKEIIVKLDEIIDPEKATTCKTPEDFTLFSSYTTSTCAIDCYIAAQKLYCNCTHHFMPPSHTNTSVCGYDGLICLTRHFGDISLYRKDCKCPPSCESQILTMVYELEKEQASDYGSEIKIYLMKLPGIRYVKRETKTKLNFIISFGGIVGLIFGLSFLSAVEYLTKVFKMLLNMKNFLLKMLKRE